MRICIRGLNSPRPWGSSFSWIGTKGHRLSVSIGPTGKITYAYRRIASKVNGTEWLGDRIPEALLDHIATFLPRA